MHRLNHTTRRDSDKSFFSCSGSCFSLADNFQFPGNRWECEQNTFLQCMYRCVHCVSTSHCTHPLYHIRGSRKCGLCAPNSLRLLRSVLTPCTVHSARPSCTSPTITGLQRLITSRTSHTFFVVLLGDVVFFQLEWCCRSRCFSY